MTLFTPSFADDTPRRLAPVLGRYPRAYAAFLAASAADVVLTLTILSLGGVEVNPVAAKALAAFGPGVLAWYKLASVVTVLAVCESLARLRPPAGAMMARGSAAFTLLIVVYSLALIAANGPYTF